MKIAQFRNVVVGYNTILNEEQVTTGFYKGYAQLSEWIEVTFPPLGIEAVEGQLTALKDIETELRTQFQAKLDQITAERAKLLAITHQPAELAP